MQLTVVCLLGIASCAYAQFAGVGFSKNVTVDIPGFSFGISKDFGVGGGFNRRKRDVSPNDPPERPRLIAGRGIGDRFKPRPDPEDSSDAEANGPKSQHGKLGVGAPGHFFPHLPPFRPHHHGRRPTTTSPPETTESADQSNEASSEASNEESNESSSEPSSEPDSESGSTASSEASNEDSNESNN